VSHTVRAFIHHFDDRGRRTKPAKRVFAMLCIGSEPQALTIELRDKRTTRFRSVSISRAELERVLKANPR
jgi:hypothetical protein